MKATRVTGALIVVGLIVGGSWWLFDAKLAAPSQQLDGGTLGARDESMSKGERDAPVEMIQFVDMMCTDCARSHEEVMPQIEKNYIDSGKLYYEVRVVTKINHDAADIAAQGAYCAADQGKFWPYLDLAFEKLHSLPETAKGIEEFTTFSGNNARAFAEEVGVNVPTWEYCVKQGTYKSVIDQHEKTMSARNAYGTPHSVINGEDYNGAPQYSVFKAVIDAELKKKQEKTT